MTAEKRRLASAPPGRRARLPRDTAPGALAATVIGAGVECRQLDLLESVLTEGGELDRQVNCSQNSLAEAHLALLDHHAGQAKNGSGQNICSAIEVASKWSSAPSEAVRFW